MSGGDAPTLAVLERRAKLFEWYVSRVWNIHRQWLGKHLTKRCSRCAIADTLSLLNADGVCAACVDTQGSPATQVALSEELGTLKESMHQTLQAAQQKGVRYDALVLFSGGKDSIFLIHKLKTEYPGLRILAYLVDSGFMGPRTLINAQEASTKLEVDYIHFKPDARVFKALYREAALFRKQGYGCLETGDLPEFSLIVSMAVQHAAQNDIPYVIDGLNWAQVEVVAGPEYITPPSRMLGRLYKRFEEVISEGFKQRFASHITTADVDASVAVLHPFFVWRFEETFIRKTVVEHGYVRKGSDSPLLTNNSFVSAMFFVDYARNGYGSYEKDITDQVRAGTADRLYWRNIFEMAEYSAKTGWLIRPVITSFKQSLGLEQESLGLSWQ